MKKKNNKLFIFVATLMAIAFSVSIQAKKIMDQVLVIVNDEVITQSEYDYRMLTVMSGQPNPNQIPADLPKQLLEAMIADRLQLQEADRRGIKISDDELNKAIGRFAAAQKLSLPQLKQRIESQGQAFARFRESVRESLVISRLTEYYAQTQVTVPDYEIDGYIEQNGIGEDATKYQIAHILIKDDSSQNPLKVRDEIAAGMGFQRAVLNYSEALDAQEGGVIGWRSLSELPEVFANAIKNLDVGEITPVLKSPNGSHILKLINIEGDRQEVVQAKIRHILIKAETKVARAQAIKKLAKLKARILAGEDFSTLARIYSDDSVSAANGGDLGWVSPGETVPAFEQTFTKSNINQVSEPFESRFGAHILEVVDRRNKNVTEKIIRNRVDNILRRKRAEREFDQWVRELKEGAYIVRVAEPS